MGRKQDSVHYVHQVSGRTVYLTPKWITDLLGPFDLDPCASHPRPWDIAKVNMVGKHNGGLCGLEAPWKGFVWLNPPYGKSNGMDKFIAKLAAHREGGICLINANTQTVIWHKTIWPQATAFVFLKGRISFYNTDGTPTDGTFGSPVFVAFGEKAEKRLSRLSTHGYYIRNNHGN